MDRLIGVWAGASQLKDAWCTLGAFLSSGFLRSLGTRRRGPQTLNPKPYINPYTLNPWVLWTLRGTSMDC